MARFRLFGRPGSTAAAEPDDAPPPVGAPSARPWGVAPVGAGVPWPRSPGIGELGPATRAARPADLGAHRARPGGWPGSTASGGAPYDREAGLSSNLDGPGTGATPYSWEAGPPPDIGGPAPHSGATPYDGGASGQSTGATPYSWEAGPPPDIEGPGPRSGATSYDREGEPRGGTGATPDGWGSGQPSAGETCRWPAAAQGWSGTTNPTPRGGVAHGRPSAGSVRRGGLLAEPDSRVRTAARPVLAARPGPVPHRGGTLAPSGPGPRSPYADPPTDPRGIPPVPRGGAPDIDRGEASALAAAFAVDYLSWDEDDPQRRGRVLLDYLPTANPDPCGRGWSGHGRQRAEFALPGLVRRDADGRLLVDVRVRITPYRSVGAHGPVPDRDGGPDGPGAPASAPAPTARGWRSLASAWIRLTVPIRCDGRRLVVDAGEETFGEAPSAPPPEASGDAEPIPVGDARPAPGGER